MEKIRRNERMSVMMKLLSSAPNRIYTLNSFCDLFGSAKSTMSEDVDLLRDVCSAFDLGTVETVTGAAGGVRYRPAVSRRRARETILELCGKLSGTERVLPGGFLYYSDILSTPDIVNRMGEIIASEYAGCEPDFVLTMETKGIPVAFATANALGIPLVIARHSSNVDDFLRGGGTAKGMVDLMREFNVTVAGMAFVMATVTPEKKRISGEKSLMTLSVTEDEPAEALVRPAEWLLEDLQNRG